MKVELISLKCEKFKGFVEKEFLFEGKNASIFGANATGKSTVCDAFTWLLFGKNAAGESDFEIKPKGKDGKILFPGSETVVSAVLSVDGEKTSLKRVFKEVWTTKRGAVDAVFSGNTTDYFVDDYPVKKTEYEAKINGIIEEKIFRLISSVTNFFKLHPKEQREILFAITNPLSDYDLAQTNPEYSDLCSELSGHTIEELRKKLCLERKILSENRGIIPARLDELARVRSSFSGIDFARIREEFDTLSTRKAHVQEQIASVLVGVELPAWETKLSECLSEIKMLNRENDLHRKSQRNSDHFAKEREFCEEKVSFLKKRKDSVAAEIDLTSMELASLEKQIQELREEYIATDKKKPVFGKECPTCKRPYEEAALRAAESRMLSEKKERLDEIQKKATELSGRLEKLLNTLEVLKKESKETSADYEAAVAELKKVADREQEEKTKEATDLPEYTEKMEGLRAQEGVIRDVIAEKSARRDSDTAQLQKTLAELEAKIRAAQAELSKESVLEETVKRIEELEKLARDYAERIEDLDRRIFLCESFTKYKISCIEESINRMFEITSFKLFREQINGGITDTCEALRDGIPYSDLNNGSKVNVGVDVVNSLSKHYGVSVPLFVDNAEGVTHMLDPIGQAVKLYVSANDKEMRCVAE